MQSEVKMTAIILFFRDGGDSGATPQAQWGAVVGRGLGLGGRLQRHLHPGHHLQHDHRVQRDQQQVSALQLQLCRRYALSKVEV